MAFDEIRVEEPADIPHIRTVTEDAFRDRPYADGDEQDVIDRLRADSALSLSLVATLAGKPIAHVAFSPAHNTDGSKPWYALGPVSVTPELQSEGIGAAIIEAGLARIRSWGARGCILTGNPVYYRRFGFELAPENTPEAESAEYFMLKCFDQPAPSGLFQFHRAFYGSDGEPQ